MTDPTQRPHELSPAELEALLGRGSMARWQELAAADRDRLTRDLEALQRTAREIANATRELHADVDEPSDHLNSSATDSTSTP